MAHYKTIKYPAFLAASLCLSLNAFGSTAISSPPSSALEEKGEALHNKRARIESPAPGASSSSLADVVLPTREEMLAGLTHKVKVLISELPKAQTALSRIEGELLAKVQNIQSANFLRVTAFTGLISSVKMLKGSIQNTVLLASRDCSHDDNVLGLVAITVIGSGALKDQLMKFSGALGGNADTQDIDCSVLRDVCASIHEITKDIADPFQE
jgi:hypothetical protein